MNVSYVIKFLYQVCVCVSNYTTLGCDIKCFFFIIIIIDCGQQVWRNQTTGLEIFLRLLSLLFRNVGKSQLNVSTFYSISQVSMHRAAVTVGDSEGAPAPKEVILGLDQEPMQKAIRQKGCHVGGQEWGEMRSWMF